MADRGIAPPKDVKERTDRSLSRLDRLLSTYQECWEFARGNQYVYRNDDNQLIQLATTASVSGGTAISGMTSRTRPCSMPAMM